MSRLLRVLIAALISGWTLPIPSYAAQIEYSGEALHLKESARACYMVFVKLYDIEYYKSPDDSSRCVKLRYLRDFSNEQLDEATRKIFANTNGYEAAQRYNALLEKVGNAYQAVTDGESYQYCVIDNQQGVLAREGEELISIPDSEFANQFLRIWIKNEKPDGLEWNFRSC